MNKNMNAFKEVGTFLILPANQSEIVTLISEDYVEVSKGFKAPGLMQYWLPV